MEKPFFSIIIPVYNRADIIMRTIDSVLNQIFKNFEIIVVDDGSKDNTAEVIKSIPDARVKYIYQNNAERSVARNNGANHANGEYLIFLDSDDTFDSNHLSGLFSFIEKLNIKIVLIVCNCRFHFVEKDKEYFEEHDLPKLISGKGFEYVLSNPLSPTRMCLHSTIFKEFQFDKNIVIVEDQVLWVSIATKFEVVQYKDYTVNYTIHDDNSVNLKNNAYLKRLEGLKRLFFHPDYSFAQRFISHQKRRFILAECYFNIAKCYRLSGDNSKKSMALFKSFLQKPGYRNKERLYMLLK